MSGSEGAAIDWSPLDDAYRRLLGGGERSGGILLAQTLFAAPERRSLLNTIPLRNGIDLLDVGTGFGVVPFELAHLAAIRGVGVDTDPKELDAARRVGAEIAGWLAPGSSVRFEVGSAGALAFPAESFDLVTTRLLLQHLPDPARAVKEFARVLRRGGVLHVFDVDDGLSVSWPPPADEVRVLEGAFAAWQGRYGGDREIGRKIPAFARAAGLEVIEVKVVPVAAMVHSAPRDESRVATAGRLADGRAGVVAAGLLSEEEFARCLDVLLDEPASERFVVESRVIVVAKKP